MLPAAAYADTGVERTTQYHWKRVEGYADIPRTGTVRVLLLAADGRFADKPADYEYNGSRTMQLTDTLRSYAGAAAFDTLNDCSALYMTYQGWDSDNDCPMVRFTVPNEQGGSGELLLGQSRSFSILSGGEAKADDRGVSAGRVKLFVNVPSKWDRRVRISDGALDYKTSGNWSDCDEFAMFVAEETRIATISRNLTVAAGDCRIFDGTTHIRRDVVITVEEGAVLCLSGTVYFNGSIRNFGTVVIDRDARVGPKELRDGDGNSITTYSGGTLLVLEGARLAVYSRSGSGVAMFFRGGQCYNLGVLLTNYLCMANDADIRNEADGIIYDGCVLSGDTALDGDDGFFDRAVADSRISDSGYTNPTVPWIQGVVQSPNSADGVGLLDGGGTIRNKGWFISLGNIYYASGSDQGWGFLKNLDNGRAHVSTAYANASGSAAG